MRTQRWPSGVNGRLLFFALFVLAAVSDETAAASARRKPADPYNQQSNQLAVINHDDYSLTDAMPAQVIDTPNGRALKLVSIRTRCCITLSQFTSSA